jgi:hypothetical protein
MYHFIHDHFKTILLFILVVYAAINYSDRKCEEQKSWNKLVEQHETTRILNKMDDYLAEHEGQIQYFLNSHPII